MIKYTNILYNHAPLSKD